MQVARQRVEAIVRVALHFFLHDRHAALAARVRTFTPFCFVLHDVHPLDWLAAVDARHLDVGTDRLMLLYVFPYGFGLALRVGDALGDSVVALEIVALNLVVAENLGAAHFGIVAHELHTGKFFLDFLLDRDEAWLGTHHGTLACFLGEFVQADLMKSTVALFALPGLDQDRLTQRTKQILPNLLRAAEHIARVHRERHSFEIGLRRVGRAGGGCAHGLRSQIFGSF